MYKAKPYLHRLEFTHQGNIILLALLWIITNLVLFLHKGIVTGYEAEKYITNADHLLRTGHLINGQFRYYFTEIILIALAKQSGTFPYLPILIQLSLNAYATLCFYKLLYQLHHNWTAVAGTALLLIMVYYQEYNFIFLRNPSISAGLSSACTHCNKPQAGKNHGCSCYRYYWYGWFSPGLLVSFLFRQ
jgi:hypothetical protein